MLRQHSEVFRTLCAGADLGILAAAWGGAYALRFHTSILPPPPAPYDPESYALLGGLMLPLWHLLLRWRGHYEPLRGVSAVAESRGLIGSAAIGTLLIAAATFLSKEPIITISSSNKGLPMTAPPVL